MSRKLVTVFGATGNQGGSVARLLLEDKTLSEKYKVRAVTRDPSKAAAQSLSSLGAELVQADINDLKSIETAIAGSYAVFGVTNYWESMSKAKEIEQGKNIVLASKAAKVRHLIWSSLPDAEKISEGSIANLSHFVSKAEVERFAQGEKTADFAVSYFMPAFFMSNFGDFLKPESDGTLTWASPMDANKTNVPLIDVKEDTGKFVTGLLEAGPEKANGVSVQGVSQWATPSEIATLLSGALEKPVKFVTVPVDVFKGFLPAEMATELAENMDLVGRFDYYGKGTKAQQAQSDAFLLPHASSRSSLDGFAKRNKALWAK